mgnify:CR=1 FL=1
MEGSTKNFSRNVPITQGKQGCQSPGLFHFRGREIPENSQELKTYYITKIIFLCVRLFAPVAPKTPDL